MDRSLDQPPRQDSDASASELVRQASEQISQLTRQELALAQAEMQRKAKQFGTGGGLLGGAGAVGFIALQAIAATAIVALDLIWPLWGAALTVTIVLLAAAGALAAMGKKQVGKAAPPTPEQAIDSVKNDIAEIKERAQR
ncbi:putative superfamily III holin-X [Streptomyces sp. SLBN-118]|uniref:phage holin family protein n=1 Tax=Streptomyces sp. SLBN-118 TaxID=2768454 RepID=UPI001152C0CB|nr:phage holin family protein [Streptomyces sp. SLBN-118]TQK42633.1 putative superfamily III holin-X [Streptomyces sp. SLBN-118]